ncbi:MAG TPA: zf-HC2 domain-containing protein [Actinomycetes bacterium]|nr:zf-HC2 domain-containing protein [Actinomycetes bacterium]
MTTATSGWHADRALLDRYLRGEAGGALGSSVEAHLLRCATCRERVRPLVDPAPLDLVWSRLEDSLQAPRPGLLERLVRRLGLSDEDALLLAAAPSLRTGWLWGTAVALVFAALAAAEGGPRGASFFLVVAPLVPVAGVAVSYGPDIDDAYEPTLAAPYPSSRLLMLRALATLLTSIPLAALGGLLLPWSDWSAATWLLPAVAGVTLTLAGATWVGTTRAGAAVAVCWLLVVAATTAPPGTTTGPATLLTAAALPVYAAVAVTAAVVFQARSGRLALMGRNA